MIIRWLGLDEVDGLNFEIGIVRIAVLRKMNLDYKFDNSFPEL